MSNGFADVALGGQAQRSRHILADNAAVARVALERCVSVDDVGGEPWKLKGGRADAENTVERDPNAHSANIKNEISSLAPESYLA